MLMPLVFDELAIDLVSTGNCYIQITDTPDEFSISRCVPFKYRKLEI